MSKFALLAAGLLAFIAVSDARAAEVVDVSEGYNGIKWGESFDSAFAKLKEKFGPNTFGGGRSDFEGFEGKSIGMKKDGVYTGYFFIEDRFVSLERVVEMDLGTRYVKKDFDKPEFVKTVTESFQTGKDVSLTTNVYLDGVNEKLDRVTVYVTFKNIPIYDAEIAKLKATRPQIKKMLLESVLAP